MPVPNSNNIESLIQTGNLLASATQNLADYSKNPSGIDSLAAFANTYGLVAGAIQSFDTPFAQALGIGVGIPFSSLGVAISIIQLNSAWNKFQVDVHSNDTNLKNAAIQEMGDKLAGTLAAIGGTMAAIPVPGVQQIGLGIWLGGTAAQQILNGNVQRTLDILGTTITNSIEVLIGGPHATIAQYSLGGSEIITTTTTDRYGIAEGIYTHVTGTGIAHVTANGHTTTEIYDKATGETLATYLNSYGSKLSETTISISDQTLAHASAYGHAAISGSDVGNTVEFSADLLDMDYGEFSDLLEPGSYSQKYASLMDWFDEPIDYYQNLWDNGIDADAEAGRRFSEVASLIGSHFGVSNRFGDINIRVAQGIGSPIVIDLNGDGINTIDLYERNIQFDLVGNGTKERVGWLSAEDAFIAMDRNNNGKIDDASELFGSTVRGEGYAELATMDDNHDGVINAFDTTYADLTTWQDSNLNGLTDEGELQSLASKGITKLDLSYTSQEVIQNGNLIGEILSAEINGSVRDLADVYFRYKDTSNRAFGLQSKTDNSLNDVRPNATLESQNQSLVSAMAGFGAPVGCYAFASMPVPSTLDKRLAITA